MTVVKTIRPNEPGAKRYFDEWGEKLVAVRYRKSEQDGLCHTTIEIIVETRGTELGSSAGARPNLNQNKNGIVAIRIKFEEKALRERLKRAGALWSQHQKLWLVRYKTVSALGLTGRIVAGAAENCKDVDFSILL